MKILIFSQYYYPENFLINDLAEKFVSDGNEVTVVTGLPNYPSGVVLKDYRGGRKREESINGVRVLRCWNIGRGKNKLTLLANYLSYMLSATKLARKLSSDYDVVFLYQLTPIFQAYPAIRYSAKNKKKLVCYCCDLAPESGSQLIKKHRAVFWLYYKFSKWAYNSCHEIGVTSRSFIEYLHTVHKIPKRAIFYLPQHASDALAALDLGKTADGPREFMFAGNLGLGASLDTIIYAADILKKKGRNFKVNFIGDGSARRKLRDLTEKLGLSDIIIFHKPVPMSEMGGVYKTADALLVTLRKGQTTIPAKLQAYMATGKPIIGAMDGSGMELIKEAECGRCASAENFNELAEILDDYLARPGFYKKLGENGRSFFLQNFTLDNISKKWEEKLSDIAGMAERI